VAVLAAASIAVLVFAPAASAHPLGNFTVNSFSGLVVEPQAVGITVVVDSAEIPTVQQFPAAGSAGEVGEVEAAGYAEQECARLRPGLLLSVNGARQPLTVESSSLQLLPGQAGLPTMRLSCQVRTRESVDTAGHTLEYVDRNSLDRTGWREITAVGDGVVLDGSTVPSRSVSEALSDYPADLLSSPLDQRSATAQVTPGDGVVSGMAASDAADATAESGMGMLTDSFTELVSARELGVGFALFALGVSVLLGALHAFAPGHGKTLMAAYLLGQRSSLRQVGIIGLTVTLTHTAGVLVLGVILSAVAITAPERIYGWLGVASGLLLLAIGASLLRQARRRAETAPRQRAAELVTAGRRSDTSAEIPGHAHDHEHAHGNSRHPHHHDHTHDHPQPHGVTHSHGWGGTHTHPPPATSARGLVAVGFAGGMVPSPSALIVLLGGIALGRAWFGVLLVLGYGAGMALALIGTGLALAHARDRVERLAERRLRAGNESNLVLRLTRLLPVATASLVMVVGIGLSLRSALTL